jgi:cephalosporin-C deacetylase-like acetyl esterase
MDELSALPPAPELTVNAIRSGESSTVYDLYLTSIGPYRIYAFYSIPQGEGPFPVIFHTGGYGSVVHIGSLEERQKYVTVALRHRGRRLADKPFAAAYPGLLTTGINSPDTYIYRGIVADCVRVIDFLRTRPEVDASKIAVVGDELALMTAALRPEVDALYTTPNLFYGVNELAPRTNAYPLEEYNDYARFYPDRAAALWNTVNYFNPLHFAPKVKAETVLVTGNERDMFSPEVVAPLVKAFGKPVHQYVSAHSSYKDGVKQATWLAERYGLGAPVLPPHWS